MRRFYSDRLCRHQQESFQRGGKKNLTLVAATNLPSRAPLQKKKINNNNEKKKKTLGVQSWDPGLCSGSAEVHWLSTGGERRARERRSGLACALRPRTGVAAPAPAWWRAERSSCAAPPARRVAQQRHWAGFKVAPRRPRAPRS